MSNISYKNSRNRNNNLNESLTSPNVNDYFFPLDMNIKRNASDWLIAGLKTTLDNLGILHRNIEEMIFIVFIKS